MNALKLLRQFNNYEEVNYSLCINIYSAKNMTKETFQFQNKKNDKTFT